MVRCRACCARGADGVLHAPIGVFQSRVTARRAGGKRLVALDPTAHPVGRRVRAARVETHALYDHQPLDSLRESSRVHRCDGAAKRMRHHGDRRQAALAHELGDVLHVLQVRIRAAERPRGIAVAAQVRRHDVVVPAQGLRQPIPRMAMIVNAVHQQHVRRLVVAPVQVVQAANAARSSCVTWIAALGHHIALGFETLFASRERTSHWRFNPQYVASKTANATVERSRHPVERDGFRGGSQAVCNLVEKAYSQVVVAFWRDEPRTVKGADSC